MKLEGFPQCQTSKCRAADQAAVFDTMGVGRSVNDPHYELSKSHPFVRFLTLQPHISHNRVENYHFSFLPIDLSGRWKGHTAFNFIYVSWTLHINQR